ncbi:MAG: phosphatidate cytidylyltransferase [Rickettsiales bacterium]|jgi:CDP-diglyceride synthetase|nr:phosphatidate cytidylyltransferase [Rickettsiales bacterium]
MEKEKFKDSGSFSIWRRFWNEIITKFKASWRKYSLAVFYFATMFISSLHFKNLYTFLVLGLGVFVSRKIIETPEWQRGGKTRNILFYIYTVVPSFSMLYIPNLKNSADFILWISTLLLAVKTSTYIFESIFEGSILSGKLHPTKTTLGLLGSILVSVPTGLIASLFLRQKLIKFTLVNMLLALVIHIQDIIGYRLKDHLGQTKENLFMTGYNNLALLVSVLMFITLFKFITL